MRIMEDADAHALPTQPTGTPSGQEPFCALSSSVGSELSTWAAAQLDPALPLSSHTPHRPTVRLGEDRGELVLFSFEADGTLTPIRLLAGAGGLLVVGEDDDLATIREHLTSRQDQANQQGQPGQQDTDTWAVLIDLLHELAVDTQDVLDQLSDQSRRLETRASGFTSAPERRAMAELRNHLFSIQEIADTQHRLLAADGELAQTLSSDHRRQLRRSANAVDAVRSRASQLYARLGDVLQQQGTIINERLTFVATIFLPLNLVAGVFGMNFGWLTDRIGTFGAFLGLGVVLPLLLTGATMVLTHRVARSS